MKDIILEVPNNEFDFLVNELLEDYETSKAFNTGEFKFSFEFYGYDIVECEKNSSILYECINCILFMYNETNRRYELNRIGLLMANLLDVSILELYEKDSLKLESRLDYDEENEYDCVHAKIVSFTIVFRLLGVPNVPILSESLFS